MESRRTVSGPRTASLLAVTLLWAAFLALTGAPEAILFTVPVFLLAAPLALGRYVGEGAIESLRGLGRRPLSGSVPLLALTEALTFKGRPDLVSAPVRGPPNLY